MNFDVFGPFEIPRIPSLAIIEDRKIAVEKMMKDADDSRLGLTKAPGCYIFVVRAGKGYTPWYIGKSVSPTGTFIEEALGHDKLTKYNLLIAKTDGTPMLFLLPAVTDGGKFCKRTAKTGGLQAVDFLEQWLIGQALNKNPDLLNVQYARFLENLHVPGIFNPKPGKQTAAARELVRAIS